MKPWICWLWLLTVSAVPHAHAIVLVGVESLELTVDGAPRTALVYVPKTLPTDGAKVPLVFVFHGHGSNSAAAIGEFGINRRWPEAISVYPQGLNIPSITDPEGVRSGWQHGAGEVGDRDLRFFDALLARLQQDYPVDPAHIYATGHSNGGGFTYLLWAQRPTVFAAFAPCSSAARFSPPTTPKPALLCGGRSDPLVKFPQQEKTAEFLRKLNGCNAESIPEADGKVMWHPSAGGGTPLATFFYDGEHGMVPGEADLIVWFFRGQPAPPKAR